MSGLIMVKITCTKIIHDINNCHINEKTFGDVSYIYSTLRALPNTPIPHRPRNDFY